MKDVGFGSDPHIVPITSANCFSLQLRGSCRPSLGRITRRSFQDGLVKTFGTWTPNAVDVCILNVRTPGIPENTQRYSVQLHPNKHNQTQRHAFEDQVVRLSKWCTAPCFHWCQSTVGTNNIVYSYSNYASIPQVNMSV